MRAAAEKANVRVLALRVSRCDQAGEPAPVHPHLFRHARARQIVRTTESLPIAQKQTGSSRLQMAYRTVGDDEVRAAIWLVSDQMTGTPPGSDPPPHMGDGSDARGLERLVFFSDAVIAIAITLLAIEIHLPAVQADSGIPAALISLWPEYLGFLISFLAVGSFWYGHHRMFRDIGHYDDTLLSLNIVFLVCIAFIPFASSVLGEHFGERNTVIFYSLTMIITGLANTLLWLYASHRHRLIDPGVSHRAIRLGTLRNLTAPAVFLASLPLTLIHPFVAIVAWVAIYPILVALVRTERASQSAPAEAAHPPSRRVD